MKLESKVTWLSISLGVCAVLVGGLGWYTWTLHRQMDRLDAGSEPIQNSQISPDTQPGTFDPFAGAWDPNGQFARMQKHMDEMMQDMMPGNPLFSHSGFGLSTSSPEVSLNEDKDNYTVVVKVPEGEDVEFNTSLDDNMLTISGEVKNAADENPSGNASVQARSFSQFSQTITLADPVDETKMKVDRKGEEIVITIPKRLS